MAPLSDREALLAAWRGLAASGSGEGLQTIPLGGSAGLEIKAAKAFPEGREAFLVGCAGAVVPGEASLPQANGFRSTRLVLPAFDATWFAVLRKDGGSLGLFASMALDVLNLLQGSSGGSAGRLRQVIGRVSAWQRFMDRGGDGLLRPEEEIGLFGELAVLRALLSGEEDQGAVIESWKGPLGALHDFRVGSGALEVKSAVVGDQPQARISSLNQLDTSMVQPMFLVAVRLTQSELGLSLGDLAEQMAEDCSSDPMVVVALADRLVAAGLPPEDYRRYVRRFEVHSIRVHQVAVGFPRLTRANVPQAVVSARYAIDLDLLTPDPLTVVQARDLLRNA